MSENPLKPLGDERADGVVGGYIFCADELNEFPVKEPWEVIDDKGDVVARFEWLNDAREYAKQNGYSTDTLSWPELEKLRETGSPW